jgi:HK97 family phage prohead protease
MLTVRSAKSNAMTVTDDGVFSGYACVFDEVVYGSKILPGAFLESLKENRTPIMLFNHDVDVVLGTWLEVREDGVGLFVRGQLNLKVERAREIHSLMMNEAIDGLSIAFTIVEFTESNNIQLVTKADLWEISVVTFPAQETAHVDSVLMNDTIVFDEGAKVRKTTDGYLVAMPRVARTGVQVYRGSEVGRPDKEFVRVYRPHDEVFNEDSLKSYTHRPVTNDHPPVPVNAANWKQYSKGQTGGEVVRDGTFVRVPMVVMDQQAISDYDAGKRQLSLGYSCALQFKDGVSPDGEAFDAVQTNIRANHLAMCKQARGGPELKIGDDENDPALISMKEMMRDYVANSNNPKDTKNMTLKTMTIDSINVEMTDTAAQVVQRFMTAADAKAADLTTKLTAAVNDATDAKTALAASKDAHVKDVATKDAEIATLKKQLADAALTPAKLDDAVKERTEVVTKAKAVLGDKLVVDGKSTDDIKKQVVDSVMSDAAKGWNVDQISASFGTITSKTVVNAGKGNNALADALSKPAVAQDTVDALYAKAHSDLQNAWKTPASA